jgi:hypothetical protein
VSQPAYRLAVLDAVSLGYLALHTPFLNISRDTLRHVELVRVRVGLLAVPQTSDLAASPIVKGLDSQLRATFPRGFPQVAYRSVHLCVWLGLVLLGLLHRCRRLGRLLGLGSFLDSFLLPPLELPDCQLDLVASYRKDIRLGDHLARDIVLVQVGLNRG